MKMLTLMILAGTMLGAACRSQSANASQSGAPAAGAAPTVIEQWTGAQAKVTAPSTRTIKTVAEWQAAWDDAQQPSPRALNVTREMAVAVFLGERRTGGFTSEITGVVEKDGKLAITYRELTPAPDMMVTQALTYPWVIAVVTRSDLPIVFERLPAAPQPRRE